MTIRELTEQNNFLQMRVQSLQKALENSDKTIANKDAIILKMYGNIAKAIKDSMPKGE